MANIKHNRPQLRLSDNISRELRRLGQTVSLQAEVKGIACDTRMPSLPESILVDLHSFLVACAELTEATSNFVKTVINSSKKRKTGKATLISTRSQRDSAADELVFAATKLSPSEIKEFSSWCKWLERGAIKRKDILFLDIVFEEGLKAAFDRALET
ncbi:MAG: hypothetical protein ABJN34_10935 [Litoreibacter sp.]|uniref:hypothetical protein n=1 Tax=Litoreibacter sp. TaxID=1969459 RepID=UPI00329976DC